MLYKATEPINQSGGSGFTFHLKSREELREVEEGF